jgi:hypothetical protein
MAGVEAGLQVREMKERGERARKGGRKSKGE